MEKSNIIKGNFGKKSCVECNSNDSHREDEKVICYNYGLGEYINNCKKLGVKIPSSEVLNRISKLTQFFRSPRQLMKKKDP
jgi:hypothetical protein